jgi:hypothetical protein
LIFFVEKLKSPIFKQRLNTPVTIKKLRQKEKMETHYDLKKGYSFSQNYERDLTQEEKDNLFKEAYSNIALFERLVYEAKQNSRKRR